MAIKCPIRPKPDYADQRRRQEQERARREWARAQERAREYARERARQQRHATSRATLSGANQAIALELVNIGYRAMSRKHHPDLGGSHEQMVAINQVCDYLRLMISNGK
jgi:hypothetical protein